MPAAKPLPSSGDPVRVLIVDDHPMVAEGIQSILESYDDIEIAGILSNGREVIAQLEEMAPDVILMDLNMPELGGLSATEIVLERRPDMHVVILTMHDNPEYIASALSHGAQGYLLKDVPTEEIKTAIDTVMSGKRYLCTGAQGSLAPKDGAEREALTEREQTILLKLAQGRTNKDVAQALDISVRTVETHRKNIKRKLGISSTAGLTRYAMEHGVLQGTGARL
ncbi:MULTISPECIES: response regulator transcription factor [unclassified Sulfitobacter]|uniref:response regulator transcription factor n=1 Tax=unclassified Sulfitobacter TaxID=196795 RepID=UPI0007C2B28A|nr:MULTISPECIES: response regulator transcription factor [unclassified Sulfitobacter]KZY02989.1 DNA-binding response regulator [Sulfitobacter sp. HI0023]KZY25528.1 DNA-binding response regulator [Sulfitobacter sp. HI0040]KZZ66627.1 DNA-binding response regulator [Sulfitobacter sp. HI0129]